MVQHSWTASEPPTAPVDLDPSALKVRLGQVLGESLREACGTGCAFNGNDATVKPSIHDGFYGTEQVISNLLHLVVQLAYFQKPTRDNQAQCGAALNSVIVDVGTQTASATQEDLQEQATRDAEVQAVVQEAHSWTQTGAGARVECANKGLALRVGGGYHIDRTYEPPVQQPSSSSEAASPSQERSASLPPKGQERAKGQDRACGPPGDAAEGGLGEPPSGSPAPSKVPGAAKRVDSQELHADSAGTTRLVQSASCRSFSTSNHPQHCDTQNGGCADGAFDTSFGLPCGSPLKAALAARLARGQPQTHAATPPERVAAAKAQGSVGAAEKADGSLGAPMRGAPVDKLPPVEVDVATFVDQLLSEGNAMSQKRVRGDKPPEEEHPRKKKDELYEAVIAGGPIDGEKLANTVRGDMSKAGAREQQRPWGQKASKVHQQAAERPLPRVASPSLRRPFSASGMRRIT